MINSLKISTTTEYKKGLKKIKKQNKDLTKIIYVINKLANQEALEDKYHDYKLIGYGIDNCRECHIEPDWLLIYRIDKGCLILLLIATGSHSDLFE